MYAWDMRKAMKTYARSPVHSLCALCPSPAKDQLTKTANLETQRGKSSQKHPGYMREAIKTYARRTVHSLCNLCFSPPRIIWHNYCPGNPKGHIKPKLSWDMPEAIKTLYYDAHSPVDSLCNLCPPPPGYCNLQSKISTSVPANLPGAVNYDRKQRIM